MRSGTLYCEHELHSFASKISSSAEVVIADYASQHVVCKQGGLVTHQKRPEPLGMLLRVNLLNLDAETELPDKVSKAMRFWDRLTGSTADE